MRGCLLTSSSDADTYSLVFFTASKDRDLRRLRDVDAWERALALFPDVRPLRSASTPITDIQVMAGATDRRRSSVVDGRRRGTILRHADYHITWPIAAVS